MTPKNFERVLANLRVSLGQDPEFFASFCSAFDDFLDDLVGEDFFGTEAQLDPRGDQRG